MATTNKNIKSSDRIAIHFLAEQDNNGETHDSYAETGDAEDTILRWRSSAAAAGDLELVEIVDRIGVAAAARIYRRARSM